MSQACVRIIGMPLDLGADRRGVDMGPDALRNDGLAATIEGLGLAVEDSGDVPLPPRPPSVNGRPRLKFFDEIVCACRRLKERVQETVQTGRFPLVLGGDHSIAIGTLAGLSACHKKIGLLWIDAHGDFNTDETTITGNIHGMSFAAALGIGNPELVASMGQDPAATPERSVLIGARDLDPLERANLKDSGVTVFTMHEIDALGMHSVMQKALEVVSNGTDTIHLSFDLDAIDPVDAPGVGFLIKGGISFREARLIMEMTAACRKLGSLEVVELNPILDRQNMTGKLAIDLIATALGKRLL